MLDSTDKLPKGDLLQQDASDNSLHDIAVFLLRHWDMNDLLEAIVTKACEITNTQDGFLFLLDPAKNVLEQKFGIGVYRNSIGCKMGKEQEFVGKIRETGKHFSIESSDLWAGNAVKPSAKHLRTVVGTPLTLEGELFGVIGVSQICSGQAFPPESIDIFLRFSDFADLACEKAQLFSTVNQEMTELKSQLQYIGQHDSLTGLYNRSFFETEMQLLDARTQGGVGLVICDVDGLKLVNDTLGHAAGDGLLIEAAEILRRSFCASDVIARIGGDEYAILLQQTSRKKLATNIARIHEEVKDFNAKSGKIMLSISVGCAFSPAPGDISMNSLFKAADTNMYREKLHQGLSSRNAMIKTLVQAMETKDFLTDGHADRLQKFSAELASALLLPDATMSNIRLLAKFHDLGKVGVPDSILEKEGPLTDLELVEIRRHPEVGYRIAQSSTDLLPIADFILKHHEWWNGQGYPFGLKGESIPLECRILSIVDAFDAMTSQRPYHQPAEISEACDELRLCAGIQFDPFLVELFLSPDVI